MRRRRPLRTRAAPQEALGAYSRSPRRSVAARAACTRRGGGDPRRPGSCDGLGHVVGVAEQSLAGAGRSSPLGVETGEVALTWSGRGRGAVDRVGQAARQRGGRGERATEAVELGAAGLYLAAGDYLPNSVLGHVVHARQFPGGGKEPAGPRPTVDGRG